VGTSFALGIDPSVAGDYQLEEGAEPAPPDRMIVNTIFERQLHVRVGDTLDAAVGFDPQLRTFAGRRRLVVVGEGQFYYTPLDAAVAALPLATLQAMGGPERTDRVSLFMARVRHGVDPDRVAGTIARTIPGVSVLSTAAALDQLDERMSYFRQLALVLGATSSIVGFLLVTTLVTVSVQERAGEIVVLRAIGVSRPRVVGAIVLESLGLTTAGAVLGVGLGLVTARYFNSILSAFPNLPAGFRFFVFHPTAAWLTGALLIASGLLASVYPSWRAASLPIAATLRREATA
jgi:putative ABC transport system permease protein